MSKRSVPFSLDEKHIDFINRKGDGKNVSGKLRSLLDEAIKKDDLLVIFSDKEVEDGNYEPEYVCSGGFLVFQKTMDSREYGENLPFQGTVPNSVSKLVPFIENCGYRCQLVEYPLLGFTSVWAAPKEKKDKCFECRKMILERLQDVLQR